ncbi:PIN domain-containing protein [Thermococcus waiotapuensis]|uniref:PIN domain-containing protein n=1 Tax=Thermococcus waiotapuensis TaxID=90909 RepID=A0AAE4NX86_9EURY|nr:PIN domain-containing protein [Thermococcus waiotapuensis]MDV3104086.1 PIN domain-containing protein [Thermococcus waiotapuensis]
MGLLRGRYRKIFLNGDTEVYAIELNVPDEILKTIDLDRLKRIVEKEVIAEYSARKLHGKFRGMDLKKTPWRGRRRMGPLTAFVDTNVIIEHLEGNVDLLDIRERLDALYSNSIVFSEALMVYLRALTGERPYTLKHSPDIIRNLSEELLDFLGLFGLFIELEINRAVETLGFAGGLGFWTE